MSPAPCGVARAEAFSGLPCHRITLPCGDSVLVALHGAHVLSWSVQGVEQLYLSPRAVMDGQAAIRGGVPICFPQFNQRGKPAQTRFCAQYAVDGGRSHDRRRCGATSATVVCQCSLARTLAGGFCGLVDRRPQPRRIAIHADFSEPKCNARRIVTGALHTYLAVDDIAGAEVTGLAGQPEWNALTDVHGPAAETLSFNNEFDRVYASSISGAGHERWHASSWPFHKAQAGPIPWCGIRAQPCAPRWPICRPDGYAQMLCIEAAQVMEPITVAPGAAWQGWQRLVSTIGAC